MTKFKKISDYYPLAFDLKEKNEVIGQAPDGEELVKWACQNHLSKLHILLLLIKNAFEFHVCKQGGLTYEMLVGHGTQQADPEEQENHPGMDLSCNFIRNFSLYRAGILSMMEVADPDGDSLGQSKLINFVLSYQLWRFPVSLAGGEDHQMILSALLLRQDFFSANLKLPCSVFQLAAQQSIIDHVNDVYQEQFSALLLRLNARENALFQLISRLNMANDPSIVTEQDLDKRWFELLVAKETKRFERKHNLLETEWENGQAGDHIAKMKNRIRKVYKTIAKHCMEVHIQTTNEVEHPILKQCFIEANNIYTSMTNDLGALLLQHSELVTLLARLINNRKIMGLPIFLTRLTQAMTDTFFSIEQSLLIESQDSMKKNIEIQWMMNGTEYKSLYVKDQEMKEIHENFLIRRIEYVETRITQVHEEIRQTILQKMHFANKDE
jgi:hypothetical protein